MKVLMIIRATALQISGGDTIQAKATAHYLKKLGIEVDLKLTDESIDYAQYDLLHFFNIIRPSDILHHLKKTNSPFVISPIYVDYSEFDKKARGGLWGLLSRLFSGDSLEYAKVVARMIANREMIQSRNYLLWGHRKSVQYLIKKTALLLPNSENELKRLLYDYKIKNKYHVVPNGIDARVFPKENDNEQQREGVLCVAQIHGRKNQLDLIKALRGTGLRLTIIGKPTPNGQRYYEQCRAEADENVKFIDFIPQQELVQYYRQAKVHVLPSWFETTGLSSLEAAAMGCNIVITKKGDAQEYFGNRAFYCDPGNIESIRDTVVQAHEAPVDSALKDMVYAKYTWEKAAAATLEAYKKVLP